MNELAERLFEFAAQTIKYVRTLPTTTEYKVIRYQLIKSSTSAGANYEEAQAGSSRADFSHKTSIALREMREANYWLRMVKKVSIEQHENQTLTALISESAQLKNILGKIVAKTKS